ncbi:MAG: aldose epimerase family protein [Pseudorhodobacter sp.]
MIREFGRAPSGIPVQAVTMEAHGLRVEVLTWGAALRSVRLDGVDHDLTQGVGRMEDFEQGMGSHGVIVGPVANRIGGARAVIAGREYLFETDRVPGVTLHSGPSGLHRRNWDIEGATPDSVQLRTALPDGTGGFPGNRVIRARYSLHAPATLRLTLDMDTDAPTLANLAHHGYWNLDGGGSVAGHRMRIASDGITEVDEQLVPTGRVLPVAGTGFDFREMRAIVPGNPPIDTNFCLSDARMPLREVMWLQGQGGVAMALATTEPGLQIYDQRPGHAALAIEPQFWPDAANQPGFPSILLEPGQAWQQVSEWRFGKVAA